MLKILFSTILLTSFICNEAITKITYSNSNCNSITSIEKFKLSQCHILSLGGQLFSIKVNICNNTNWQTSVYFNNINCTEPLDLLSTGLSNTCYLSDTNLHEKILCIDPIPDSTNNAINIFFSYFLTITFIALLL